MLKQFAAAFAALFMLLAPSIATAEDLAFEVINDSSLDLLYFYTTPSSVDSWGEDLLGSDGTLPAHTSGTATIADGSTECVYDFKYIMSDGETYYEQSINLCDLASYRIHD